MFDISKAWPDLKAVEKLGEGSFGKVYKCEREEFGIKSVCAVKVISIPQSQAEIESMSFEGVSAEGARSYYSDVVRDFANEIKLMEMLKGAPNIVNVENFRIIERENEIGWDIYIRMEYLQSFVSYSKNKKFTEEEVKKFALDISNALAICSKNGIIHRDIKPDNIFIDKFGSFKLGDFGVARRLEGTMSVMSKKGTYSYMAPEVFKGEKYDCRADIYSLGMVMYKLLNRNRDPFLDVNSELVSFKDRNEAIERRRSGERLPAPVDASPSMAAIILKACEYRPENRYSSVEEFREALNKLNAPVAFAEEPTVASRDYFDKTVAARDIELPAPIPAQADFDDTTVVVETPIAEESTVIMGEEATVIAYDEPTAIVYDDATVIADDEKDVSDNKKSLSYIVKEAKESLSIGEDNEEYTRMNANKFVVLGAACLVMLCVIAAALLTTGQKPYNQPKTSAYSSTAEYSEEPKEFYYEGSLKTVGDYITLGSYEQDNNTSNGKEDIEWLVLEINDDKALLISKFALDCQSYSTGFENVTWETCTLRSWLNNEFIDTAFTEYEKAMIPTVTVPAGANPSYSTDPGNDTQDKIFLLSIDEANEFFDSDFDRECKTSNYASEKPHSYTIGSDNCMWLLRSPGYDQGMTTYVESNGSVYEGDASDLTGLIDTQLPIRPALWINLNM